jgi:hypothetical protein
MTLESLLLALQYYGRRGSVHGPDSFHQLGRLVSSHRRKAVLGFVLATLHAV